MKSVLRCQNKPKAVSFSIIDLLIDRKKSKAACRPLKRPGQAFSWLSISQCFVFQSRKAVAGGKRGDVIRWSVIDLLPRFAPNSLFAFDFLFIRFFSQTRGAPDYWWDDYSLFLEEYHLIVANWLRQGHSFVEVIFLSCSQVIDEMLFSTETGNPIFLVIRLSFGLFLLYVVYRVIKRAITKV